MRDGPNEDTRKAAADRWRAPWSGQRVSLAVRAGAGFFVIIGAVVALFLGSAYLTGGKALEVTLVDVAGALLAVYVSILFGRVAITGRAPRGWIPWQ